MNFKSSSLIKHGSQNVWHIRDCSVQDKLVPKYSNLRTRWSMKIFTIRCVTGLISSDAKNQLRDEQISNQVKDSDFEMPTIAGWPFQDAYEAGLSCQVALTSSSSSSSSISSSHFKLKKQRAGWSSRQFKVPKRLGCLLGDIALQNFVCVKMKLCGPRLTNLTKCSC